MKISIKIFAVLVLTFSLSSIYAQSEAPVTNSGSNLRNQSRVAGDPVRFGDVKLGKSIINETDESWEFINVRLTDEQKEKLLSIKFIKPIATNCGSVVSHNPTVGKRPNQHGAGAGAAGAAAGRVANIDDLLSSGNFIISKKGMTPTELKAMTMLIADWNQKRQ